MAGGPSTPELTAAVSNAGGLGSLGSAYTSPEKIVEDITAIRRVTDRPFAVNLFAPQGMDDLRGDVAAAEAFLAPDEAGTSSAYRAALRGAREHQTVLTKAFSGMARGINNEFIQKW